MRSKHSLKPWTRRRICGACRPCSHTRSTTCTRSAAARTQAVAAPGGFSLAGHPRADYNGVYRQVGTHEGWPHFENEGRMRLYRYQAWEHWWLDSDFSPEDDSNNGGDIESKGGAISVGAQVWQSFVRSEDELSGFTFTVTALQAYRLFSVCDEEK